MPFLVQANCRSYLPFFSSPYSSCWTFAETAWWLRIHLQAITCTFSPDNQL